MAIQKYVNQELTIEIDEIEATIKRIMDEEIQSSILTIPGISYQMSAMIIAEIEGAAVLILPIRYFPMQECLHPLINQGNSMPPSMSAIGMNPLLHT